MSPPEANPSRPDPALEAEALYWLLEREEGFAPGRAEAFAAWCAADPRHGAAVEYLERGMALLRRMPEARPAIQARAAAARPAPGKSAWSRAGWLPLAAAAVVVLGLTLGWWTRGGTQHVVTAAAVQRDVALADGSIVQVNARSELRVRVTPRERRVTLDAGEAHFAVAHDPSRPFVVQAGGYRVRAVGTAFNVRTEGDEVEVTVFEGRVVVSPEAVAGDAASALGAGERARVRRDAAGGPAAVERVDSATMAAALAWHRAPDSRPGVPLGELVAAFNRRGNPRIVIVDAVLASRHIGGSFSGDRLEPLLHLLEQEDDIRVERHPGGEIRLHQRR